MSDRIVKVLDEDGNPLSIDLYELAEYFIKVYPEDIFVNNPKSIIKIRDGFKEILELRRKK